MPHSAAILARMAKIVARSVALDPGFSASGTNLGSQHARRTGTVENRGADGRSASVARAPAGEREPARRGGFGRIVRRILLSLTVLVLAGAGAGFLGFVGSIQRSSVPPGPADAIVALTGGAQRIGDAAGLLASRHGRRLLISGVHPRTTREDILRANPEIAPFVDCCVDLDHRARNTIGNAIETRRWVASNDFRSLIVVTSNYHMPRSLMELGHALPGTRLMPYSVVVDPENLERWWLKPDMVRLLAAEYAKFLVAAMRTRIERDPEGSQFAIVTGGRKPSIRLPQDL